MEPPQSGDQDARIAELEARLAEAEETLRAIRGGEVDALLVSRPEGDQVFTLQGAETTYRFLVEEMNEGALLLGPEGTVLYANARFADLAGVPLEQVIGASWERLFAPADQPRLKGFLAAARSSSVRVELGLQSEPGSPRPVGISLCSMQRERVQGFSVVVTDLTEIRKLNESLENRVQERTVQLTAANKELEAFSYSVSHDLRAPVRHIVGFATLLSKKAGPLLNEKSQHYIKQISDSAAQMGRLIDDLLVFSRMGRAEIKQQRVALQPLVEETIRGLSAETEGRTIRWTLAPLPVVQADPALLRQVLVNLLSNAVKYTRPRQPAEIQIGRAEASPGEVVIFVRDNGVGFDMQYADKLFGVFQRLHLDEDFEGTGIGLANVRRIIARHGGRTWAEAKVNGGATFYFSLPNITPP